MQRGLILKRKYVALTLVVDVLLSLSNESELGKTLCEILILLLYLSM